MTKPWPPPWPPGPNRVAINAAADHARNEGIRREQRERADRRQEVITESGTIFRRARILIDAATTTAGEGEYALRLPAPEGVTEVMNSQGRTVARERELTDRRYQGPVYSASVSGYTPEGTKVDAYTQDNTWIPNEAVWYSIGDRDAGTNPRSDNARFVREHLAPLPTETGSPRKES